MAAIEYQVVLTCNDADRSVCYKLINRNLACSLVVMSLELKSQFGWGMFHPDFQ